MERKATVWIALAITIVIVLGSSLYVVLDTITGFASYLEAEAGTISALEVEVRFQTVRWQGYYGLELFQSGFNSSQTANAVPGGVNQQNFVFECLQPDIAHELYASTVPLSTLDFSTAAAATYAQIDAFIGADPNETSRAENTFRYLHSYIVSGVNLTNVPTAFTNVNGVENATTFATGALNISGQMVWVAQKTESVATDFKGEQSNYQILVGTPNSSLLYHFSADPGDECPEGLGVGIQEDGRIYGYVQDNVTGAFLEDVLVSIAGISNYTDANGLYNFSAPAGDNYLIGIKDGYETHINLSTVVFGSTVVRNFSMVPLNGTVIGNVTDETGARVGGVTVSIGGDVNITPASGVYSLTTRHGRYVLGASASGYDNYLQTLDVDPGTVTYHNITLEETAPDVEGLGNGTLLVRVFDSLTSGLVSNATVSVVGQSTGSNATGEAEFNLVEGSHTVVVIKSGFLTSVTTTNIVANNLTEHNVSLISTLGYVNGTVTDSSSAAALSAVNVTIGGSANTSAADGSYLITAVAGTKTLVGSKSGYLTAGYTVIVNGSNTTTFDFTLEAEPQRLTGVGAGSGAGAGAGAGAGTGIGPGVGPGVFTQPPQPVDIEYELTVTRILKSLRKGTFATVPVGFTNYQSSTVQIDIGVEGDIAPLIALDKGSLSVDPSATEDFIVTILANVEPGLYTGKVLLTGDIDAEIIVEVLVFEEDKLPIETLQIQLEIFDKIVNPGDLLRYKLDLQNLLKEEKYTVFLTYSIQNVETGEVTEIEEENVLIVDSLSLLRSFVVPKVEIGDYVLVVNAEFIGFESSHQSPFRITQPLLFYSVFGIPLWVYLLILGLVTSGSGGVLFYKHQQAKKKRYTVKVDYNALPKPGPRSAYIGKVAETNNKVYFDLDLFQVHTLIAGSSGSGKSFGANILIEEALIKGAGVIVFDPTAQWSGFLRKNTEKKLLELYPQFGMKKEEARAFGGNVRQILNPREYIDITRYMKPGEITIFAINRLEPEDIDVLVANIVKQVFKANLPESKTLKLVILFDEVHRLLPKFGGSGKGFLQIERAAREFRKWGVGLLLISQVLTDFAAEIKANINTQVQMRTRDERDLKTVEEEYGAETLRSLVKASIGTGLVQNSAYNNGKPFFVSFRPILHSVARLTDEELASYNKYNDMVDEIEYQIQQLTDAKVDVFDLNLELKLSKDKLKAGNFNMVGIYLDSLRPRIESQFQKLGITPKKFERKLFADADLEEQEKEIAKRKGQSGQKDESNDKKPPSSGAAEKSPQQDQSESTQAPTRAKPEQSAPEQNAQSQSAPQPAPHNKPAQPASTERTTTQPSTPSQPAESQKQNSPPSKQEAASFNSLVTQINSEIQNGMKDNAKVLYAKLQQQYTTLPTQEKAAAYNTVLSLREKLV